MNGARALHREQPRVRRTGQQLEQLVWLMDWTGGDRLGWVWKMGLWVVKQARKTRA